MEPIIDFRMNKDKHTRDSIAGQLPGNYNPAGTRECSCTVFVFSPYFCSTENQTFPKSDYVSASRKLLNLPNLFRTYQQNGVQKIPEIG